MSELVVDVVGGRFGYGSHVAVEADLRIAPGEVIALLGPNGSGKTTLLKGILGLVDHLDGTVELFGVPIAHFHERRRVGYVPQRQSAVGPIPVTVRELVRSGRLARRGLVRRRTAGDDDAVEQAIDAVGLAAMARTPVGTLSGGQQRRAMVARALAGGADALFLDEPFAGIDQTNQHAVADTLAALVDGGATVVVVLHELGPLEPIITRVVCMDGGRIRFDGAIGDAPPMLLHLGHDHDPHGGPDERQGIGLLG